MRGPGGLTDHRLHRQRLLVRGAPLRAALDRLLQGLGRVDGRLLAQRRQRPARRVTTPRRGADRELERLRLGVQRQPCVAGASGLGQRVDAAPDEGPLLAVGRLGLRDRPGERRHVGAELRAPSLLLREAALRQRPRIERLAQVGEGLEARLETRGGRLGIDAQRGRHASPVDGVVRVRRVERRERRATIVDPLRGLCHLVRPTRVLARGRLRLIDPTSGVCEAPGQRRHRRRLAPQCGIAGVQLREVPRDVELDRPVLGGQRIAGRERLEEALVSRGPVPVGRGVERRQASCRQPRGPVPAAFGIVGRQARLHRVESGDGGSQLPDALRQRLDVGETGGIVEACVRDAIGLADDGPEVGKGRAHRVGIRCGHRIVQPGIAAGPRGLEPVPAEHRTACGEFVAPCLQRRQGLGRLGTPRLQCRALGGEPAGLGIGPIDLGCGQDLETGERLDLGAAQRDRLPRQRRVGGLEPPAQRGQPVLEITRRRRGIDGGHQPADLQRCGERGLRRPGVCQRPDLRGQHRRRIGPTLLEGTTVDQVLPRRGHGRPRRHQRRRPRGEGVAVIGCE